MVGVVRQRHASRRRIGHKWPQVALCVERGGVKQRQRILEHFSIYGLPQVVAEVVVLRRILAIVVRCAIDDSANDGSSRAER